MTKLKVFLRFLGKDFWRRWSFNIRPRWWLYWRRIRKRLILWRRCKGLGIWVRLAKYFFVFKRQIGVVVHRSVKYTWKVANTIRVAHIRRTHAAKSIFFANISAGIAAISSRMLSSMFRKKKSGGFESGERGGQSKLPLFDIKRPGDLCAVERRLVETRTVAYAFDE